MPGIRSLLALALALALLAFNPSSPIAQPLKAGPSAAAIIAQATPKAQRQAPAAAKQKAATAPSECGGTRKDRCHSCARFFPDETEGGSCRFCRSCGELCGDNDC